MLRFLAQTSFYYLVTQISSNELENFYYNPVYNSLTSTMASSDAAQHAIAGAGGGMLAMALT